MAVAAIAKQVSAQEVKLNLLDSCDDVSRAFQVVRGSSGSCADAKGLIEKTIQNSLSFSDVNACFAVSPPLSSLKDFRCFSVSKTGHRSLTCYRPTALSSITEFKTEFTRKYASRVEEYLKQARVCKGSNGDASRIIETTFPPALSAVAAHEFGFIAQYGNSKPGTATASHGFARTGPVVSATGVEAIEYWSIADGMMPPLPERTRHGDWRLRVDSSTIAYDKYFQKLAESGTKTHVAVVDIDLQRAPLARKLSKNAVSPEKLSEMLVSALEDEGFEEFSDEQIKDKTGRSRKELREGFSSGMTFGAPKKLVLSPPNFRLLMKDVGAKCTQNNKGAFGAYLFSQAGDGDIPVDFGGISLILVGFGSCASNVSASREYINNLAEESKVMLLDELKRY